LARGYLFSIHRGIRPRRKHLTLTDSATVRPSSPPLVEGQGDKATPQAVHPLLTSPIKGEGLALAETLYKYARGKSETFLPNSFPFSRIRGGKGVPAAGGWG
jgi:hypothetical protein